MADNYLPDDRPNIKKAIDAARISNNPVGPPAPIPTPGPARAPSYAGGKIVVAGDATPTDAAQDPGYLRPATGAFSASNPDPNAPLRPNATMPTTGPRAAAPIIATVTPATAANAAELANIDRPIAPGVQAGAASTAGAPATSVGGRPLGYGATIGGVRTFSDGSAGVPATMTPAQIAALGNESRLSRADAGPGGGIVSEAAGGTLALGAGAGLLSRPTAVDPVARAAAMNDLAQRNAASDLASIATRDPRSVAGSAARNLDVEAASSAPRPGTRAALDALTAAAGAPITSASKLAGETVQDAGATTRAGITAAAQVEGDRLRAGEKNPDTVNLADGTLGILGKDGTVRPALLPGGQPARPQIGKPPVDSAAYVKYVSEVTNRYLGADPISGMITDRGTGKPRLPTAEEVTAATRAARANADETFGQGGGATQNPTRPTSLADFIKKAKQYNPNATDAQLEAHYKATYGS